MAEKRMFTKQIIDSDTFLDMPLSTQALYFHLSMRADDDGFVDNPKKIQRMIGASTDDLKLLAAKRYILTFESGVIVIKHWRMHNTLRSDRYKPTIYKEEMAMLGIKPDTKAYTEIENLNKAEGLENSHTARQPNGNQMATQISIDKNRLDKDSIDKNRDIVEETIDQDSPSEIRKRIVDYLNQKLGSKYKASTGKTVTLINARLKENFTEEDFYTVIDKKYEEWHGDSKMSKFLRPETLFGTKFESYLNQQNCQPTGSFGGSQPQSRNSQMDYLMGLAMGGADNDGK